ncbi:putative sucrose-phosphatase 2 [Zea mays]|uniref:Putative sucrose-phosphatase 2 n=1 Tax=Zea mays TaxID=4577 RepID=A0A1D6LFN6_MAIZE|nr:putative sucrose-phosphatase 2 [Zea mays]
MPKHWFNRKFDSKKIILLILYYYYLVRAMHTSGGGLVVNCLSRSLEQLNLLLLSSGIDLGNFMQKFTHPGKFFYHFELLVVLTSSLLMNHIIILICIESMSCFPAGSRSLSSPGPSNATRSSARNSAPKSSPFNSKNSFHHICFFVC